MSARLYYETAGDAASPPVLFLHGFMGSIRDWQQIIDAVSSDFYCIAVDLPGHGRSLELQDEESYAIEGAAALVDRVLDEIGVERVHLVGYSMGGRLALFFAIRFAERCRNLVIESATPGIRSDSERAKRREVDEDRARRLDTGAYARFVEEWYRQPLFATLEQHEGLLERLVTARMGNSPSELARSLRLMGTGRQPSLWDELQKIEGLVLSIAGALDGKYVELVQQMAVLMPNMRTAIISDAGHNIHAERPNVYLELLTDFLKKPST